MVMIKQLVAAHSEPYCRSSVTSAGLRQHGDVEGIQEDIFGQDRAGVSGDNLCPVISM